jgi:hypothetical protein
MTQRGYTYKKILSSSCQDRKNMSKDIFDQKYLKYVFKKKVSIYAPFLIT